MELNYAKNWRGGERQTLFQLIGFRNRGVEVSLICRKDSALEMRAREENFQVFSYSSIFGVIGFLLFRARAYNVIHAQTAQILTYCAITKFFHQRKIVFSRRINFIPKGDLTRWKYRKADYLVGVSKSVVSIVTAFTQKKVFLISDIAVEKPLRLDRVKNFREDHGIKAETRIIGTIAALTYEKDPFTLLKAIHNLRSKREDFVFLHFGEGKLKEECQEMWKNLHMEDYFLWMGFQEEVEDFLQLMELFVMNSKDEGLGSSVLDAFIHKVPVVVTEAGGLPDLVENGKGLLCPKENPEALTESIHYALDHSQIMSSMTIKAQEYVQKFHSLEYITDQYLQLLNIPIQR